MKKYIGIAFAAVVIAAVGIVVAAPAVVTQTAAAVGKNLPPYNRNEKMNDGISDVTTIDLPAVIENLNQVITNSSFATNITVSIVNTYGYISTNVVIGDVTQAVQIIGVVTSTATITPQPGR